MIPLAAQSLGSTMRCEGADQNRTGVGVVTSDPGVRFRAANRVLLLLAFVALLGWLCPPWLGLT